ncbi:MAG: trigger factor [Lachnospiraceae bacterium]|nr:trigger factor [Lachnospiraceae bacterium]
MKVALEKLENNMARLTIEVPEDEFDKAVERAYQRDKKKISIPGFRKGKVARQVIEKMYGKDFFFGEAANICIPDAWEKAYDQCEEEIVSSPKIDVEQLELGKPFIFTAEVALNPVAEVKKYKGLTIAKIDSEVTDEDLEEAIKRDLEAQARMISVERPAADGDQVILDYEGSVDGVPFDGGKAENHPLTLGSGSFIPGFEEQVVGHNAEEDFDVNVTFPEEYHAEELAGKEAVFKCRIHEIKEKQLAELNEDFADDAGFDSVEEYRRDKREKLEKSKAAEAKDRKESAVIEKLVEQTEVQIPEAMVRTEARRSVDEYAQQLRMQGLSIQQYFQFTGMDEEKMIEQSMPSVEKNIRARLALEAVARAESMEATEEDLEAKYKEMAEQYRTEVDKVRDMMSGEAEQKMLRKDIVIQKALDFVLENAKEKKEKKDKDAE